MNEAKKKKIPNTNNANERKLRLTPERIIANPQRQYLSAALIQACLSPAEFKSLLYKYFEKKKSGHGHFIPTETEKAAFYRYQKREIDMAGFMDAIGAQRSVTAYTKLGRLHEYFKTSK